MDNLAKLVEKAKEEKRNMEVLVERFMPLIRHLAHRLPYDNQDAEQDMKLAFLTLIHRIDLAEMRSLEDPYLLGYLEKAMRNRCWNLRDRYCRERNREQPLDDAVILSQDSSPFEERVELELLCGNLTERQKQILVLKYRYGYSDAELSEKLHITRQAVNRAKNRGLQELRKSHEEKI